MLAGSSIDADALTVSATASDAHAAATVTAGSPAALATGTLQAAPDAPQRDSLLEHATADKHGLSDATLDASGIADDTPSDDVAPAVDAVLRRWSC